jgi:hypothetical protein
MNLNSMTMNSICIRSMTLLLVFSAVAGCKTGLEKEDKGGQIKDVDGNLYNTVQIGTQVWMAEDLKTTSYSDGTPIPLVENYDEWADLTLPAYCWYNNDSLNSNNFGALRKGSIASQELLVYRIDKDTIPVHPGHDQRCLALKVEKRFHHAMQYDSAL